MRFRSGNTPWNAGRSACPHGAGNMSKCGICRAAKDAAYYQRIKRDPARIAVLRQRDRERYAAISQDPERLGRYRAVKRAWWRKGQEGVAEQAVHPSIHTFLYGEHHP